LLLEAIGFPEGEESVILGKPTDRPSGIETGGRGIACPLMILLLGIGRGPFSEDEGTDFG